MKDTVAIILVLLYNLTVLGATVFLIQECEWSPWWFLLSVMLLLSIKTKEDKL